MEVNISKKSYYLPDILIDLFREWCKPGRDYSPKVAGAILYYMSLNAAIREECEKAAHGDLRQIKKTIAKLVANENPAQNVPALIRHTEQAAKRSSKTPRGA
jgi:hypothetical protein